MSYHTRMIATTYAGVLTIHADDQPSAASICFWDDVPFRVSVRIVRDYVSLRLSKKMNFIVSGVSLPSPDARLYMTRWSQRTVALAARASNGEHLDLGQENVKFAVRITVFDENAVPNSSVFMTDDELVKNFAFDLSTVPVGSEEWHFVLMHLRAFHRTGEIMIFEDDPLISLNRDIDASRRQRPARCWRVSNGNDYHGFIVGFSATGEMLGARCEEG